MPTPPRSSLVLASLLLSASLGAQIQLYTGSSVDGLGGAVRSGFVDALGYLGTKHYDSLESMAPGVTSFRSVTHGGEVMSIEHYEDPGWPNAFPRNFEVNSPIPGNRGITSKFGTANSRDMFVFDCLPTVGHWGAHLHDFESVASDPGILRAYSLGGQLLFEGDIVFPSGEDGDQSINFVGIVSDQANIATVTLSVGNTAAQVANGNPNGENVHWSAFLDVRYGRATREVVGVSATAATQLIASVVANPVVTATLPQGTDLTNGSTLVADGALADASSDFVVSTAPGRVVYEVTEWVEPLPLVGFGWFVETGLHSTLLEVPGHGGAGGRVRVQYELEGFPTALPAVSAASASVDVGNDGSTEWSNTGPAEWSGPTSNGPTSVLVTTNLELPEWGLGCFGCFVQMTVRVIYEYDILVYDNGPFVTHPGEGAGTADVSAVQNVFPLLHTAFGFRAQQTSLVGTAVADDFTVCDSPMTVSMVDIFVFDDNTTVTGPPVSAVHLAIYDGDPSLGGQLVPGSPPAATALPVLEQEATNTYRTTTTNLGASDRPVYRVRAALPNALTLAPGTYWLLFSTDANGASVPTVPPITVIDKNVTGNARVLDWLTWNSVETGINPASQGLPFRLHGSRGGVRGAIERTTPGCTGARLDVEGAPVLGGFLHAELVDPTASTFGFIGIGLTASSLPFCGCTIGHDFATLLLGNQYELNLPTDPGLCGTALYLQGLEFGVGGCTGLPIVLTETIKATIR